MWREIGSEVNEEIITNQEIFTYIASNPVQTLVDFEDEHNEDFTGDFTVIKRFVVSNNTGKTTVLIECDSRLINPKEQMDV